MTDVDLSLPWQAHGTRYFQVHSHGAQLQSDWQPKMEHGIYASQRPGLSFRLPVANSPCVSFCAELGDLAIGTYEMFTST